MTHCRNSWSLPPPFRPRFLYGERFSLRPWRSVTIFVGRTLSDARRIKKITNVINQKKKKKIIPSEKIRLGENCARSAYFRVTKEKQSILAKQSCNEHARRLSSKHSTTHSARNPRSFVIDGAWKSSSSHQSLSHADVNHFYRLNTSSTFVDTLSSDYYSYCNLLKTIFHLSSTVSVAP